MRIRIFCYAVLFTFLCISCSGIKSPEISNDSAYEISNSADNTPSAISNGIINSKTEDIKTPTPKHVTNTPTTQPSATATIPASCPDPHGYTWSERFSVDTSFITTILPAGDGNYLISGVLDSNDGTWLAKLNVDGVLLWQKKFEPAYAQLRAAADGNFLLNFFPGVLEIDGDGNKIRGANLYWMQPNSDGSTTFLNANQVMRYQDPDAPLWQYSIIDSYAFGKPTTDGGAIYAYAGSYLDDSVYYLPSYTDIKVIKIDGNGQVYQRVYGKLVGDETLDLMEITQDGGALLAGTHSYEELGSDYDIWLMKLNQVGGISWQSTLKSAPGMESISSLYVWPNSFLVIVEDYVTENMRLVRLKKNGNLAWQKEINSIRGRISIKTFAETADGGIVLAGQTEEQHNVTFLARFGPKGNLLWEKMLGFTGIAGSPESFVQTILPLENDEILVGGGTNLYGGAATDEYGAWIAKIKDDGDVTGFLTITPGKFSIINTMGSRPNTLPDKILDEAQIAVKEIIVPISLTDYQTAPACLAEGVSFPTPQALPSITPSITPTPNFVRNLYLTVPENKEGEDVLKLQQRLLTLGYDEVGVPDGIFGKMTQNAVRLFQENNGLEVDGYVGPLTWQKLFSDSVIRKK